MDSTHDIFCLITSKGAPQTSISRLTFNGPTQLEHNKMCVCTQIYAEVNVFGVYTRASTYTYMQLLHSHIQKKKCKVHTQTKKCKVQTQTKKCKAQTQMYMPSCMHSSITSFQYHCIKCYNYVNFYNSASRLAAHYVIMPNGCNSTSYRSVSSCKKNQPQPKKQIRRKKIKHT